MSAFSRALPRTGRTVFGPKCCLAAMRLNLDLESNFAVVRKQTSPATSWGVGSRQEVAMPVETADGLIGIGGVANL